MSIKFILSLVIILVALYFMIKDIKLALITLGLAVISGVVNYLGDLASPYISKTIFNTVVVGLGLVAFGVYVNGRLKEEEPDQEPSRLILLTEFFIETVDNLVGSTMGEQNMKFAPYIFALFSFLIVSNIVGVIGLASPTSNYSVTLSLALITFVLTQYWAIKTSGIGGYLKGFFEPLPFLAPLNIIGEIANPVSLSFRLFGNVLSGGIIMGLIGSAFGTLTAAIAPALNIYFDLFSGILQAFIFTTLTMVFVSGAIND